MNLGKSNIDTQLDVHLSWAQCLPAFAVSGHADGNGHKCHITLIAFPWQEFNTHLKRRLLLTKAPISL